MLCSSVLQYQISSEWLPILCVDGERGEQFSTYKEEPQRLLKMLRLNCDAGWDKSSGVCMTHLPPLFHP